MHPIAAAVRLPRSFLRLAIILFATATLSASAATLWVAENQGTLKISALDGAYLLEVTHRPYDAGVIGVDASNGNIWSFGGQRLQAIDRDGNTVVELESPEYPALDGSASVLIVDGNAGNLWLQLGAKVYRFDLQGALIGSKSLAAGSDATVALDSSRSILWVLSAGTLVAYNAQFEQTFVSPDIGNAGAMKWDAHRDELWIASAETLRRFSPAGELSAQVPNPLPGSAEYLLAPDGRGGLWLASTEQLVHVDATEAVSTPIKPFENLDASTIVDLAANPVDQSVWLANDTLLRHYGVDLQLMHERALGPVQGVRRYILRLDLFADITAPLLSWSSPQAGSVTDDTLPLLRINYLDAGSDVVPDTLKFTLDGSELNVSCSHAALGAQCIPQRPLPVGAHEIAAVIKDALGNTSARSSVRFSVTPKQARASEGRSGRTPGQATHRSLLGGATSAGSSQSSPLPEAVKPAAKQAANESTEPLVLSVTSPAEGASVSGRTVSVAGTLGGTAEAGLTINGMVVPLLPQGSLLTFIAQIPIASGATSIQIVATAADGRIASKTVSFTRSGDTPFEVIASPASGTVPLSVNFSVEQFRSTATGTWQIDYDGNGIVDANSGDLRQAMSFTYTQAGTFMARAAVLADDGNRYEFTIPIVVQLTEQLDADIRSVWNAFIAALSAQDVTAAGQYLSGEAVARYTPAFQQLQPQLPAIAASFSSPLPTTMRGNIAEYAVARNIDGVDRVFLIYFIRDSRGLWRIAAL